MTAGEFLPPRASMNPLQAVLPRHPGAFVRRLPRFLASLGLAFALASCGGAEVVGPDAALAELVGDWDATVLEITNVANPTQVADLIEAGATFTLNVQPSGQYTAVLVFQSQPLTEIGQITVDGNRITLNPSTPAGQPPTTGTYQVQGDRFILDGDTEFDFNLDQTPEEARAHFEFMRR